ncbi:hypothetical protein P886_1175 [Alteromonadaceae bacterium 2753L.S.0a.02]|nr:hypothetical protein P886_1175 [Alteromonadaceae bacterium 2753L.S.0a.02]
MKKILLIFIIISSTNSFASSAIGNIGKLVIGRDGHQIYVELLGVPETCGSEHPIGFNYAISTNSHPMAKEILSTLIAAQVAGKKVTIQGGSTCTIDSRMEDISYIYLHP